jgi:RNA polymerase sigma-70 factor (ECF subfamily)
LDRVSGDGQHPTPHEAGVLEPELPAQTILRAIHGDADARHELWRRQRRWVAAVLLAHAPRDADLDDLLQEVALAVVSKISGLRDPGAFKPWLRAVAISIAKTSARRQGVRRAGLLRMFARAGDTDAPASYDHQRSATLDEGRRLLDLAADLPDGYREPLLLKCVHAMSYKQIGQVMGLPDTTIETRIARARRMLREKAEADARDDEGVSDDAAATSITPARTGA